MTAHVAVSEPRALLITEGLIDVTDTIEVDELNATLLVVALPNNAVDDFNMVTTYVVTGPFNPYVRWILWHRDNDASNAGTGEKWGYVTSGDMDSMFGFEKLAELKAHA